MPKKKTPTTGQYVCGRLVGDIRKAYFDGELNKLCAAIMAEGKVGPDDLEALSKQLTILKDEEKNFKTTLEQQVGGGIFPEHITPPTVDELMGKEQNTDAEKYAGRSIKVREWIDSQLEEVAKSMSPGGRPLPPSFWLDTGIMSIRARSVAEIDKEFKALFYFARLTRIIDENGCSRREAEDRARLTPAYMQYKMAVNLCGLCESLENMTKKLDARDNNRAGY